MAKICHTIALMEKSSKKKAFPGRDTGKLIHISSAHSPETEISKKFWMSFPGNKG